MLMSLRIYSLELQKMLIHYWTAKTTGTGAGAQIDIYSSVEIQIQRPVAEGVKVTQVNQKDSLGAGSIPAR